jgi:hypothetical protein
MTKGTIMAGRPSVQVALSRYEKALKRILEIESRIQLAEAEAELEGKRFLLRGGSQETLDATRLRALGDR